MSSTFGFPMGGGSSNGCEEVSDIKQEQHKEQQQPDSVEYPEVYLVDWDQSQGGAYSQLHSETNQNCATKMGAKKCDHVWEEVTLSPIHFVPTPGSDVTNCVTHKIHGPFPKQCQFASVCESKERGGYGRKNIHTSVGMEPHTSQPLSTPDSGCGSDVGMSTVLLGELRSPMTATDTCAYGNTKDDDDDDDDGYRWTIPMVNPPLEEQEDLAEDAKSPNVGSSVTSVGTPGSMPPLMPLEELYALRAAEQGVGTRGVYGGFHSTKPPTLQHDFGLGHILSKQMMMSTTQGAKKMGGNAKRTPLKTLPIGLTLGPIRPIHHSSSPRTDSATMTRLQTLHFQALGHGRPSPQMALLTDHQVLPSQTLQTGHHALPIWNRSANRVSSGVHLPCHAVAPGASSSTSPRLLSPSQPQQQQQQQQQHYGLQQYQQRLQQHKQRLHQKYQQQLQKYQQELRQQQQEEEGLQQPQRFSLPERPPPPLLTSHPHISDEFNLLPAPSRFATTAGWNKNERKE